MKGDATVERALQGRKRSAPWSVASLPPSPSLRRDRCEAVVRVNISGRAAP